MYAPVVPSAVVVPIATPPLNKVTLLPASAIPSIVGVASFVSVVVVIIDGLPGAVESIVIDTEFDNSEEFPNGSEEETEKTYLPSSCKGAFMEKSPLTLALVVIPELLPSINKFIILPESAVPSIAGVESLVSGVVVVIDG